MNESRHAAGRAALGFEIVAGIRHIADVRVYEPCDQANAALIVKAVNAYGTEGFNLNKLKAELYEAGRAEHAALIAVAEAAKQIPSVPDIAVHWSKIIEPLIANLEAVRKGGA